MEWQDTAIVLKTIRLSEYDAVVTVYSQNHGKINGVVKGAYSKRHRPTLEIGNAISVFYRVRTEGQLGRFKIDLIRPHAVPFLSQSDKLLAFNSALSLVDMVTVMGQSYVGLFDDILNLFVILDSDYWAYAYCKWEVSLLTVMGYGLDLSKCAATNTTENLVFVSPKSGRAVSWGAGQTYKKKLLPLPPFLLQNTPNMDCRPSYQHYYDSLSLSAYFIKKFLYDCGKTHLPDTRIRLQNWFYNRIDTTNI